MTNALLAEATGLSKNRIDATLREVTPVLDALGQTVPTGAIAVTMTEQLAAIAGRDLTPP
ncbi:ISAzo13 family transposase, partial [Streptomyces sp. TRM76130]|nr:ISAzo13 family transposase [Streptomyces sp. TRM76130]